MAEQSGTISAISEVENVPMYTCLSCNKSVSDIEKHLNDEHNMGAYDVVEETDPYLFVDKLVAADLTDIKLEDEESVHQTIECNTFVSGVEEPHEQYLTEELDYSLLDNGDTILFTCNFCQTGFEKFLQLKDHSIISHNLVIHRKDCRHCNIMFNNHQKFLEHIKEKHPVVKLKQLHSDIADFKLEVKSEESSSDEAFQPTSSSKQFPDNFFCKECDKPFMTRYSLNNHFKKFHPYQDRRRGPKKLKNIDGINLNSANPGQVTFSCTECYISFEKMRDLRQHKNEFHNNKVFICIDCDTLFENRGNLNLHNIYHHRVHRCSTCSVSFSGRLALTNHVKEHHPGMPIYRADSRFVCEYCSQSFSIRSQLSDHIQSVHLGLVNQCEDCGKVLSTSETLKVHRLKHRPEMHRTCEHCGRQFYRTGMLTEHIRACHPEALPDDWRLHTTCPYCQSRFTRRESLRRHIEAKHEPKILICSFCERQFSCRRYLVRHENKHHLGRPAS